MVVGGLGYILEKYAKHLEQISIQQAHADTSARGTSRVSKIRCLAVGEVAEWLKAAFCKECYALTRIGGSNPSPLRRFGNMKSWLDRCHGKHD